MSIDPTPKGNHTARLYQIIHLGHVSYEWQGQTKTQDKVRLNFELCNEKKVFNEGEEPRPYSISREFGFNMSPKGKLRPFIEGMLGVALHDDEAYSFDLEGLLGEACLLNVIHEERNGNTYANIQSASQLPKGMKAPPLFNDAKLIDVNTATNDEIDALPKFIGEKMRSSQEWQDRFNKQPTVINSSDVPF